MRSLVEKEEAKSRETVTGREKRGKNNTDWMNLILYYRTLVEGKLVNRIRIRQRLR